MDIPLFDGERALVGLQRLFVPQLVVVEDADVVQRLRQVELIRLGVRLSHLRNSVDMPNAECHGYQPSCGEGC